VHISTCTAPFYVFSVDLLWKIEDGQPLFASWEVEPCGLYGTIAEGTNSEQQGM
jgi:hypothetical protein